MSQPDEPATSAPMTAAPEDATRRPKLAMPGLGLAIGVFFGNLVFVSASRGSIAAGAAAGAAAAVLVVLLYRLVPGLRSEG